MEVDGCSGEYSNCGRYGVEESGGDFDGGRTRRGSLIKGGKVAVVVCSNGSPQCGNKSTDTVKEVKGAILGEEDECGLGVHTTGDRVCNADVGGASAPGECIDREEGRKVTMEGVILR